MEVRCVAQSVAVGDAFIHVTEAEVNIVSIVMEPVVQAVIAAAAKDQYPQLPTAHVRVAMGQDILVPEHPKSERHKFATS